MSERENKITTIFHAAIERLGSERMAFLDGACVGDEGLRRDCLCLGAFRGPFVFETAHSRLNRDGKELFYLAPDKKLMTVSIKTGTTIEAGTPVPLFVRRGKVTGQTDDKNTYFPAPDGQRFLVNNLLQEGNKLPITIVLNWAANLKR